MRTVFGVLLLASFLALPACNDSSGPGGSNAVDVRDNNFSPSSTTVAVGTTVTWTWSGSNPHDVTWTAGSPAASATQTSGSYQRQFNSAGTFEYYCTIHGTPTSGMRGSVVVQ